MVDNSVLRVVQDYLRTLRLQAYDVKFGVLYGSHVSGIIHEWSDIDLVIVSPRFDGEYEWEDVGKLWVLAAQTDTRIEPVPCGLRQWEEDDVNLVIEMARREGQRVEVPDH